MIWTRRAGPRCSQRRALDSATPSSFCWIAGRYRIDAVLGRGGCATLFKATNLPMDQTVALKVLHGAHLVDESLTTQPGNQTNGDKGRNGTCPQHVPL